MVRTAATRRRIGFGDSGICLYCHCRGHGMVAYGWANRSAGGAAAQAATEITGSTSPVDKPVGRSGLPLAAFRFAQGRQDQCAARSLERASGRLGVSAQGTAGRDHRRIRELAAHPRQRRGRGLGLSEHAVRQAHGAGGALAQAGGGPAVMRARDASSGSSPSSRRASWRRSRIAPAIGASSVRLAMKAGSPSP